MIRRLVHEYDAFGSELRAFGMAYRSNDWYVNSVLSEGKVACFDGLRVVVFVASGLAGDVRGYNDAGRPLWETKIPGTTPLVVKQTIISSKEATSIQGAPEGSDDVIAAFPLRGLLVIQYGRQTVDDVSSARWYRRVLTAVIEPRTGRLLWTALGVPPVVAVRNDSALGLADAPSPHVYWVSHSSGGSGAHQ